MGSGGKLSSEDRILWGKVAKTTRPMPGRKADLDEFERAIEELAAEVEQSKPPIALAFGAAPATPAQQKKPSGQHHQMEKPVKRKIAKGRVALEARIDLHGLVQSEAHAMLHGFLMRAHERGLRHVLVITGKGSSMGSDGALKRAVPMWFSKPDFRYLISSYEPAARHHGGDGALYVRLARVPGERE